MNEIMRQIAMIESGGVNGLDDAGGYEDLASVQVALSLQERERRVAERDAHRAAAMMDFLGGVARHN